MGGTVSQPETMSAQHAQPEVASISEQEVAVTEQEVSEATSTREAERTNKLRKLTGGDNYNIRCVQWLLRLNAIHTCTATVIRSS